MLEKYREWSRTEGARDLAVGLCLFVFLLMGLVA